jgi:predicted amidohydrolase YtcJ
VKTQFNQISQYSFKAKVVLASFILCSLLSGCEKKEQHHSLSNQAENPSIYFNGDILTMESAQPSYAEAIVVAGGKVIFVGSETQAKHAAGNKAELIDLKGSTLLPAFLDPHSHYYSSLSVANQVNVFPPPAGPGSNAQSIIEELKNFKVANNIADGELIQAYGYDDNEMPKGQLLDCDDLDAAFPNNPVLVGHVSMHGAVLNTPALKKWGIDASTETPAGGIIVRKEGTNQPCGLIMETAFLPIFASLPAPTQEQEIEWSRAGQMLYAAAGITTAHEGVTHAKDLKVMQRAAKAGANIIDIIAYPFITDLDEVLADNPVSTWGKYSDRLKIGGAKITADGSPQGKTAYFSTPYLTGGPSGEENWQGEPTFDSVTLQKMLKKVYDLGVPLNYHANGDGAIDMLLQSHETIAANDLTKDRKVTIIHSQFVRKEQLEKYVKYKMRPSFYTLHTYYFSEAHIANRGTEQAMYISPMRDAIDMGIVPTNHTDFVVAPLDQMFVVWSAVNRISRGGQVIGEGQRITPYEALQAITINAALQYGEEASKGTITTGKLADLVILDKNPLKVDADAIKDIRVLKTIKEGKVIFKNENI